jgi:ABC-type branched-subunit amino acid transport system permease subunit
MSDVLVFYWFLIIGLFFIIVVLFLPDGLVGVYRQLRARMRRTP